MKLHHAAVLALVGWYLMMPPTSHTLRTASGAEISKWKVQGTFTSAKECEQARLQAPAADARTNLRNAKQQYLAHRSSSAQCIASDDPRLKSK